MEQTQDVQFNFPKNNSNYIKVIGVGGGGGNAVNFMYDNGINGVDYLICNTDAQALESSNIPNKIQLGVTLTEGLGAGNNPEIGEKAAIESENNIQKALEGNTQMIFITAGMGGGTGTGAVPIIAKKAKEMGILTVAIVTTPFNFEGLKRSRQAQAGIKKLRDSVDSLIVINNNKINEMYGELTISESFGKANEILLKAAKGMAEVISKHYMVNIDLRDARTVLENGGTAIMGSAIGEGENRASDAVTGALNSPLLNDNKIVGAKNVLVLITYGSKEATQREVTEINNYIQEQAGDNMADLIYGIGKDESLGEAISVVVVATGFDVEQQKEIVNAEPRRVIHVLDDNQTVTRDLTEPKGVVVNTAINATEVYPVPSVPEVKKEPALTDLLNIWTDCELVTTEDSFIIVDKTAPKWEKPKKEEVVQEVPRQQKVYAAAEVAAPIVHQLREEDYEPQPSQPKNRYTSAPIVNEAGEIRYTLEEYTELERTFRDAKPTSFVEDKTVNKNEFVLYNTEEKMVAPAKPNNTPVQMRMFEDEETEIKLTPMDARISDVMNKRSNRLQDYNYKFSSSANAQSRTTVGKDSSGEFQIRKNNSYLHDNVD